MIIGLPKEIKTNENRVALTPAGVYALVQKGHKVLMENSAGLGSGFDDYKYADSGAILYQNKAHVFEKSDIIVKVKEPLESEYDLLQKRQTLFTFLHLAANKPLTKILLEKKIMAIAYETVQLDNGQLPILIPMSEVAGKMSVQIGASLLQKNNGGMGILLGGVPGVAPAKVVIIGGGVVGTNAAKVAVGMGANVTIIDVSKSRLSNIDEIFSGRANTLISNEYNLKKCVKNADLLIGAVLVPGAKAPKIITKEMIKTMKDRSVVVDVAVDQGGSIETIDRITTHDNPCYEKYGVLHCSVPNLPGAVPRTSTLALESATLPYLIDIADKGAIDALNQNPSLKKGLNTFNGGVVCKAVADSLGFEFEEF